MERGAIVVLDIGKTMSKLSLWTNTGELITRAGRANERRQNGAFAVLDVEGITLWITEVLAEFSGLAEIERIIPVAHGAGLAAISGDDLVALPLDYESAVPHSVRAAYETERDDFTITGSPSLAEGLNAGVQLFWMQQEAPDIFDGATLLPWAQYWAWVLSGVTRSEITSLGCHTDLWAPGRRDFSPMAKRLEWAEKFAPLAFAGDVIGTLRPKIAEATGLKRSVEIHCGLHDSNAALIAARVFPEIEDKEATILSTGTWFVAMRTPAEPFDAGQLPMARDCLINSDAWGLSIPSSRFMGGREIETLIGIDTRRVDIKPDQPALLAAVSDVVSTGAMLQPTFAHGFGPFPNQRGRWINMPDDWYARRAAVCLYAALVADVSLDLIGAKETILIEGRFAEAEVFVQALAALRPKDQIFCANAQSDVSFGALRLIGAEVEASEKLRKINPLNVDICEYKQKWSHLTEPASRAVY